MYPFPSNLNIDQIIRSKPTNPSVSEHLSIEAKEAQRNRLMAFLDVVYCVLNVRRIICHIQSRIFIPGLSNNYEDRLAVVGSTKGRAYVQSKHLHYLITQLSQMKCVNQAPFKQQLVLDFSSRSSYVHAAYFRQEFRQNLMPARLFSVILPLQLEEGIVVHTEQSM